MQVKNTGSPRTSLSIEHRPRAIERKTTGARSSMHSIKDTIMRFPAQPTLLGIAVFFSMGALAQQSAAPAATPAPSLAASMPKDCAHMDKMTMAEKDAMPKMTRESCEKAAADASAKKKQKAKRHNHSQFHKNTG